ncbi:hypothetical protein ACIBJF_51785 [Streptomyces sp. NPDC050743]|uniref:hypothetical protein n=1 Tax=Streptomyces sp. NPDC050743 TaxID=3365634 RepID=UPI0037A03BE0
MAAGAGAFDAADVFAGPGVQRARQVFDEQRREQARWQRDVGHDAIGHGNRPASSLKSATATAVKRSEPGMPGARPMRRAGRLVGQRRAKRCVRVADGVSTPIW